MPSISPSEAFTGRVTLNVSTLRPVPGMIERLHERHHQAVDLATEIRAVDRAVLGEVPLDREVDVLALGRFEIRIAAGACAVTDVRQILHEREVGVQIDEGRTPQRLAVVEAQTEVVGDVVAQRRMTA